MKFYIDYRFIVKDAKDRAEACRKVESMIKESTEDVSYTLANVVGVDRR